MQEAGYILLMPGGDWNAETTYHILHLVNHNGASWLCKVEECTGQEPSDSNTEFWQRFGTAVDLSNYFKNTGGTVTGDIEVKKTTTDSARVKATSKDGVSVGITANDTTSGMYDFSGGKWVLENCNTDTPKLNGIATKNLPLDGGGIVANDNGVPLLLKGADNHALLKFISKSTFLGYLGFEGESNAVVYKSNGQKHGNILHTGNKPTGTYTGNGDATERVIETDGIFKTALIYSTYGTAILTTSGCVFITSSGNVSWSQEAFIRENQGIVLKTTNSVVNASGATLRYEVL